MQTRFVLMEMYRWSFACLPGAIFNYAKELDLDIEDIGIFTALFTPYNNPVPSTIEVLHQDKFCRHAPY